MPEGAAQSNNSAKISWCSSTSSRLWLTIITELGKICLDLYSGKFPAWTNVQQCCENSSSYLGEQNNSHWKYTTLLCAMEDIILIMEKALFLCWNSKQGGSGSPVHPSAPHRAVPQSLTQQAKGSSSSVRIHCLPQGIVLYYTLGGLNCPVQWLTVEEFTACPMNQPRRLGYVQGNKGRTIKWKKILKVQ